MTGGLLRIWISGVRALFPSVQQMTSDSLHNILTKQTQATLRPRLVVLDTRPVEEYHISHIEGAIQVDPEEKGENVLEMVKKVLQERRGDASTAGDNSVSVICYCSLGYRSSTIAQRIAKVKESQSKDLSSHVDVYNLEGSLFKWANEQRPMLDKDNQPTVFAHPFNKMFGTLLQKEYRKYPTKKQ